MTGARPSSPARQDGVGEGEPLTELAQLAVLVAMSLSSVTPKLPTSPSTGSGHAISRTWEPNALWLAPPEAR